MSSSTPSRIQFQDYQFQVVLPAGSWKWTTRLDVSKAAPAFEVRDVVSPYGLLRDSIPIPGDVILAMADSITQIQSSFTPKILLNITSFTFTVDEGRGVSDPQPITITNNGVFGSLLNASVATSAPYVIATPANVSGLASTETGTTQISADSTSLLASGSPYSATVTVQDPNATNTPQTVAVTVIVRPRATIALSPTALSFSVSKPLTGPFPPIPTQTFQLQNTGLSTSVLNYQIQKLTNNSPWLASFTPTFGTVNGGSFQLVTVAVAPDASMVPGIYTETLRVSGYSTNFYQDLAVTLVIS